MQGLVTHVCACKQIYLSFMVAIYVSEFEEEILLEFRLLGWYEIGLSLDLLLHQEKI